MKFHFGCVQARVASKLARCSRCTWGATPCTSRPAVPAAARKRWRLGTPEVERKASLELANLLLGKETLYQLSYFRRCDAAGPPDRATATRQLVKEQSTTVDAGVVRGHTGCAVGACRMPLRRRKNKEARILSESGPLVRGDAGCVYTTPAPGLALRSS